MRLQVVKVTSIVEKLRYVKSLMESIHLTE